MSMLQDMQHDGYVSGKVFVISFLIVFLLFAWQGNKGFSLWDEGYLWYGVQRVMLGEIPMRDFMAYDPGRYYWSAALMNVWGSNGIMALRGAVAIFQLSGLFVGLLLIARTVQKQHVLYLLLSAMTLVVWMFPRHKLFDISLSIFLVGALTVLVKNPIPTRYFLAGLCVGLVAVFGRNHGMYGALGSLGVIAWLRIKNTSEPKLLRGFSLWAAGVALGFLPIFLMAALLPGFAIAFWESIRFLFEQKTTNLPLPVPWPWAVNFADTSVSDAVRGVLVGLFFMGTLAFGVCAVLWVVRQKIKDKPAPPALVAAAFLALPYAHYAFSRSDVGHLAQGIFPLLIGCFVVLASAEFRVKWPLAAVLCAASFWIMHVHHPGWQCMASKQCVTVEISGSNLQVDPGTANDIALLRQLANQYAPNDETFIVTPFWPGAYALLERKSPVWAIYALWRRDDEFEKKEIERIKASNPKFAFVLDLPLDGRDELRFRNTHPLLHQYILGHYERIPDTPNPAYQIYRTRETRQ